MAEVTLLGAVYHDVPAIQLPQTGGGIVLFWEGTDGNNLSYGLTDGTLPLVGVAQIDYAEVE